MKETGTTRDDHYSASVTGTIRGTNVTGSINASFTGLLRGAQRHRQVLDWTCALHRDEQGMIVMRVSEAAHLSDE
jgi:sigma54-dependent transcription regulator